MEEIDDLLGAGHEGVVDLGFHEHRAHRDGAVGDAFCRSDDIRRDAEIVGAEWCAETAKGGDDLVENEQDVVLGADRGEPLQIALGRNEHAGRAGHRLDDDRGHGRGVVQRHEALEIVGKLSPMQRFAPAEGIACQVVGVADVIDAGNERAEPFAIIGDSAKRSAAEIDAVIARSRPIKRVFDALPFAR